MAEAKEKTQRRVYLLPNALVERILAYQKEVGLPSEVEAARRLLDSALKSRDTWKSITDRFVSRLKETRILSDIAGEVLLPHPHLKSLSLAQDSITFELSSGEHVTIAQDGTVSAYDDNQNQLHYGKTKGEFGSGRRRAVSEDDDIPF